MRNFKIGKYLVSKDSKPLIVAELSGNHNGKIKNILKLIDISKNIGADAIKIQTYKPETLTLDINSSQFVVKGKNIWKNRTLFDLYKEAHTPWDWHKEIFNYAKKKNILCFSTPFDETSVDFLETFNVPVYKIASFENSHHPLIEKIAKTKKPIIISSGMIKLNDLKETISIIKKYHSKIIILKCTSSYPSDIKEANLQSVEYINKKLNIFSGLSDHSLSNIPAIVSTSLGAKIIEKHLTISRKNGGIDSFFSLEPKEFEGMIKNVNRTYKSLGKVYFGPTNSEKRNSIKFRRSIYVKEKIKKGEKFSSKNLVIVRPGYGLEPKYFKKVINFYASKNIKIGTALNWNHIQS